MLIWNSRKKLNIDDIQLLLVAYFLPGTVQNLVTLSFSPENPQFTDEETEVYKAEVTNPKRDIKKPIEKEIPLSLST